MHLCAHSTLDQHWLCIWDVSQYERVFTALAFLVSAAIIYYYPGSHKKRWLLRLAMTLQLGGAIGNLVDHGQGHVSILSPGHSGFQHLTPASQLAMAVRLLFSFSSRTARKRKIKRSAIKLPKTSAYVAASASHNTAAEQLR